MKRQRTTRRNGGASFIDLMANAVEGFQRQKAAVEKNARKSAPRVGDPAPNEDFLYDFMRLNVQYLNQLARLSSNYSVIAARALERVYDYVTPDDYDDDPPPQELAEKADRRVIVRIPVENTIDDEAEFEVGCSEFQADSDHRLALKCEFQHPLRRRGTSIRFALEPDERLEVRLALRITKEMVANVPYAGTVAVTRLKRDDYDKERQKHAIVLRRVQ